MSSPGFYFYTGDWQKKTRVLTLQTKGAWVDMLCMMNDTKPRGILEWTIEQYARFLSVSPQITYSIISELETTRVAEVAPTVQGLVFQSENELCHMRVTVTSRRMKDEWNAKENDRIRQQRHRAKSPNNAAVTQSVTPESSASSSSSSISSSLNIKENLKVLGVNLDVWAEWMLVRRKIRKPMTERAVELAFQKLTRLKAEGNDPTEVIEQSIFNSWQGLFAIDKKKSGEPLLRPDVALAQRRAAEKAGAK